MKNISKEELSEFVVKVRNGEEIDYGVKRLNSVPNRKLVEIITETKAEVTAEEIVEKLYAKEIVNEIDDYLDKTRLKNSKITSEELIEFVEEKWAQAGSEKYNLYFGQIICGRMINEYAAIKDVKNVRRWLEMIEQHENNKKHPAYIRNYFRGECFLKCGEEEEALKYLKLCYEEDPEYIFTREKECIELLNRHMGNGLPKSEAEEEKDYFTGCVSLPVWEEFFGDDAKELSYDIGGDDQKYRLSKKHKKGLQYVIDNQEIILTAILSELNKQYSQLQEKYDYSIEEKEDYMPDVTNISEFADLLSPIAIHILSVNKDGMPYIGYEFSCSWDEEHGVGFMMFQDRVVEMGGADCSFLSWIARKDLEKH